jgi:SAM-dependent methyltransferase
VLIVLLLSVVHNWERQHMARYDTIGYGYSKTRREDPRFRALIHEALGDARTVVNVGAGTGAYEPLDRHVIAIEPSDVMAGQRSRDLAPAIRASADSIPLRDRSVDAAMTILSLHHWDEGREKGVRELRRVARGAVVILTYDAAVSSAMWLMADYLPEVAALDLQIFPAPEQIAEWLGGDVRIDKVPIPCDTPDWMLGSFWAHPERVLDPDARAATSGFARMPASVIERVVSRVSHDLSSGLWDDRYGHLRSLHELDVGLRLIVAT